MTTWAGALDRLSRWFQYLVGVHCVFCKKTAWRPSEGWELYSDQTPLSEMVCPECLKKEQS